MEQLNLQRFPFGKDVIVYDYVSKYGDWLFKQALIESFQRAGYFVYSAKSNTFLFSEDLLRQKSQGEINSLGLVFTRMDRKRIQPSLLKKYSHILELQRIKRFSETLIYWRNGKIIFQKEFRRTYEQERIRLITEFLGLTHKERCILIKNPKDKKVAISFNADENSEQRLKFNYEEVNRVLLHMYRQGYKLIFIKKPGTSLPEEFLRTNLIRKVKVLEPRTIEDAFRVVESCSYYFGADSGLTHHAVQKGIIVFSLFNKKYHGRFPLFNTQFINHMSFFGDRYFAQELIRYIDNLGCAQEARCSYGHLVRFLRGTYSIIGDPYSNRQKFLHLIIYLSFLSGRAKQEFHRIKNLSRDIFFADRLYEFDYSTLPFMRGRIFIESRKFAFNLQQILKRKLGSKSKGVSIFARNCSFFRGMALKRGISDIDFPIIYARGLSESRKKWVLKITRATLRRYSFSTSFPHQSPVLENNQKTRKHYYPIIRYGQAVFFPRLPGSSENLEKVTSRLKTKIILGEISKEDFDSLVKEIRTRKGPLDKKFITEINYLLADNKNFNRYGEFIRKIESLLASVGIFGTKGVVVLRIDKYSSESLAPIMTGMIAHGLIYISQNRMYINWDLRRPQHWWSLPIHLVWEGKSALETISHKGMKSPVYNRGSFKILKNLRSHKISPRTAAELLNSESFLVITEAFNFLRRKKYEIDKLFSFSQEEINKFLRLNNSNCVDKRDKKIILLGLLIGKPLTLSPRQFAMLSKYNLFMQYVNTGGKINICATNFFCTGRSGLHSTNNFFESFRKDFVLLLRQCRLYLIIGIDLFFLKSKKEEILFQYFVGGRSLMEGPKNQSQKVSRFLTSFEIVRLFTDIYYLDELLERFKYIKVDSEVENCVLLRILAKTFKADKHSIFKFS